MRDVLIFPWDDQHLNSQRVGALPVWLAAGTGQGLADWRCFLSIQGINPAGGSNPGAKILWINSVAGMCIPLALDFWN